jgi:hypothetical protein
MKRVKRRRTFAPTINPLEGRVLLSQVAFAASHATAMVEPLAKSKAPALSGSVSGSLHGQVPPNDLVGNTTAGSLAKYGSVTGVDFFVANNAGTITASGFELIHGGRRNKLKLSSNQNYSFLSVGETNVDVTFRVRSASGVFARLKHESVTAELDFNLSANSLTATFP